MRRLRAPLHAPLLAVLLASLFASLPGCGKDYPLCDVGSQVGAAPTLFFCDDRISARGRCVWEDYAGLQVEAFEVALEVFKLPPLGDVSDLTVFLLPHTAEGGMDGAYRYPPDEPPGISVYLPRFGTRSTAYRHELLHAYEHRVLGRDYSEWWSTCDVPGCPAVDPDAVWVGERPTPKHFGMGDELGDEVIREALVQAHLAGEPGAACGEGADWLP